MEPNSPPPEGVSLALYLKPGRPRKGRMRKRKSTDNVDHIPALFKLPRDLLRIILEEVYDGNRQNLRHFRRSSRVCANESNFLYFRTIVLSDQAITGSLIARLKNPNDAIVEHVRHIQVTLSIERVVGIWPGLDVALRNINTLQTLSWNTNFPMPPNVLEVFHEAHPDARLYVTNHIRNLVPLDHNLLSSPQLHSLSVSAYSQFMGSTRGYNELQIIKKCLIKGGSIKVLNLRLASIQMPMQAAKGVPGSDFQDWEGVELAHNNFEWVEGDAFPALEELSMRREEYDLSEEQCKKWAQCMDWSQMKRLDFRDGSPRYLFERITGRVPQLQSLSLMTWSSIVAHEPAWNCPLPDISIVTRLIEEAPNLAEIYFTSYDWNEYLKAIPAILRREAQELKHLVLFNVAKYGKPWTPEQFMDVLNRAPTLRSLRIESIKETCEGNWAGSNVCLTPKEKYDSLVIEPKREPQYDHSQESMFD